MIFKTSLVLFLVMTGLPAAPSENMDSDSLVPPAAIEKAKTITDRKVCGSSFEHSVFVEVTGMKALDGNIRVQLYGNDPNTWLEKGAKLLRIERKTNTDPMFFCVPLPKSGEFGLIAMHDRNSNGKANVFSDGFAFSNNPKLGLSKPNFKKARVLLQPGLNEMSLDINYYFGRKSKKRPRRR